MMTRFLLVYFVSAVCCAVTIGIFPSYGDIRESNLQSCQEKGTQLPSLPDDGVADLGAKAPDASMLQHEHPQPPTQIQPPDDPCLLGRHVDWRAFGVYERNMAPEEFEPQRILLRIDRSKFRMTLQLLSPDDSTVDLYSTSIALGDPDSPTPKGRFLINHVYCYPDVLFFLSESRHVPDVYDGFFAPLLLCHESGRCERFNDLGIHGFRSEAHPNSAQIKSETFGPVTGGCIRIPDPCELKHQLISRVGLGPLRRNERGSYHWLNKPVSVWIEGDYPGTDQDPTLLSLLEEGVSQVQGGLHKILDFFTAQR